MTREEAIRRLTDIERHIVIRTEQDKRDFSALEMAISALEQEPCDDAISRKAVLEKLNEWDWQELYLPIHFKEHIIDELPSVTPSHKECRTLDEFIEDSKAESEDKGCQT